MMGRFEEFVLRITQIYMAIQKLKLSETESLNLRGAHVMCLYELGQCPEGISGAELARRCGIDRAAVSRTIADLKRRGMVRVESQEGKRNYRSAVTLTEDGVRAAGKMGEKIVRVVERVSGDFSEEERVFLYRALEQIAANLQEEIQRD